MAEKVNEYRTGDSLVGRSSGLIGSGIALWTALRTIYSGWGLPWCSHTAAILVRNGKTYVYESTTLSKLPDAIDGQKRKGVQCHELGDWLRAYDGPVWHVPLARPLLRPDMYADYLVSRHKQQREYDTLGAVASASWIARGWQWITRTRQKPIKDESTGRPLFCSLFYLRALQEGGIWPPPDIEEPERHYPRSVLDLDFSGKPRLVKEG